MEGVRTQIARIVLRHSTAWRNAFRMHSSPNLWSKSCGEVLCKSWIWDLPEYPYQSLSKFFRNPRFWSGVLCESWILDLGFCKECILNAFLQNAECPKYKEESKSTFCLLPSVCVFTYVYIYIYMVPIRGKTNTQNSPNLSILKPFQKIDTKHCKYP